ncbi:MAG: nucleotidyltransferase family protein [Candidatus Humimicrobiaceae bacterium]
MKNEQRFIAECIRAFLGHYDKKKLKRSFEKAEIKTLNNIIFRQNIAGYFNYLFQKNAFNNIKIPEKTLNSWKNASARALIINTLNDRETINIIDELKNYEISYLCIKGPSIRRRLYENQNINSSVDIDLFIKKTEYIKVKDILLKNDYKIPIDYYVNKIKVRIPFMEFEKQEYKMCFTKKQDVIQFIVDLQWDFIGTDKTSIFHNIYNFKPFYSFEISDEIEIEGNKISVFPIETEFINMAFHFAFHHGFQGIKWLTDLCLFIKKYEKKIDFEFILKTADVNIRKILGITLMFAYDFNYQAKLSRKQKKLFCVDRLLPFEYRIYKNMIFKFEGIVSDRIALRIIKILLPYTAKDRFLVIRESIKFMVKNLFKK